MSRDKGKLLIFFVTSALLVALGLVVMGVCIIYSTYWMLYGNDPNIFDPKVMTVILSYLIDKSWKWLTFLSLIPLALFLALWKVWSWLKA